MTDTDLPLPEACLPAREPAARLVLRRTCHLHGLSVAQVLGVGRRGTRRVARARKACCLALRALRPSMTVEEIAEEMGLDHTTVLYHLGRLSKS